MGFRQTYFPPLYICSEGLLIETTSKLQELLTER